ncbi:MAG: 30S ribosomal protein S3 [Candidatus Magasanikbacteria bacterium]|uniref:Small ribosomal subunit protein uS3 n=1 Tax=Candidatus Magasanikbacteria bacterium CG10_big_fil_rev_8_21_14_0_10_38_6 TaxID=1974647 RepID=A0A2M6P098_9BACT|nr:30S ribosomal protein S3 [Candidatus Magasanikbacteria bacterium]NCS71916.1 30S ribosomal protein S3 [Candidatus Magasanikbacteria bacterium]PIR77127.1 MAG: 30S ribosomal protein S3 [Candidatus Magasanikbacteria bacterium CG10_big_fil_rev_8_21_14_0_10_38_6]
MGHKVHPKIHRTQVIYTWDSRWFGKKKDYALFAKQDIAIRAYISKKFKDAHVDAVSVERGPKNMTVTILAAKPGFIIGRGGKGLDEVRQHIEKQILAFSLRVKLNIREVKNPSLSAMVVGQSLVSEIERRIPFRRVMKQAIGRVMKAGAQGVKVQMAGRLNGAEIARTETIAEGTIPLITLRSDVDYAFVEANTIYGKIGVKVWICRGQLFTRKDRFEITEEESQQKKQSQKAKK